MNPSSLTLRAIPMLACSLAALPRTLIVVPENLVRSRELLAAGDERLPEDRVHEDRNQLFHPPAL